MNVLAPAFDRDRTSRVRKRAIYIDITDLMQYAEHNATLSGIQRVNASLLANINAWHQKNPSVSVIPVIPEYNRSRMLAADLRLVTAMFQLLETRGTDRHALNGLTRSIYASRETVTPRKGDVFVMAGAFWICQHYDMIVGLRSSGVKFGLFIHDLIQINNPEYVQHVATLVFRKSLIDALTVANFVMTNSEFVAQEVRAFLKDKLNFSLPVRAIQLATELRPVRETRNAIEPRILQISRGEYVLCVGTIEIRKNHLYIVKIWERLLREFDGNVPDLIFIGKWGWKVDELREYLNETNYLGGRVHVFDTASDIALAHLYEHCRFTAYTTFAEGFGLPVGESLAHGKPCITSNVTSLPEVGRSFARYVDPFDLDQGYEVFRETLFDRAGLDRWAEDIRLNYRAKTWSEFSDEFFDSVVTFAGDRDGDNAISNCVLDKGTEYFIGDDDIDRLNDKGASLVTFRMARISGWLAIEPWGCWAADAVAKLKFLTREKGGTKVVVLLLLHVPPGSRNITCAVNTGGVETHLRGLSSHATWHLVDGEVSADGSLEISFHSAGSFGQPDTRTLTLGIHALAYCPSADLRTRAKFYMRSMVSSSTAPFRGAFEGVRGSRIRARQKSTGQHLEETRRMVERLLAERESAARMQPLFHITDRLGAASGPYQIGIPDPSVVDHLPGEYMTSAICRARDFYNEHFAAFCRSIEHPLLIHRKLWEFAFVAWQLGESQALLRGNKGLGFGVGADQRLPALFARLGCDVLATDMPPQMTEKKGRGADRRTKARNLLFYPEIVDEQTFEERVRFDFLEAGSSDAGLRDCAFCWSCGYVDKLGSVANGLDFIVASVEKTLKIGGVACHTSELNISSNERTSEADGKVVLLRRDIEALIEKLESRGHEVRRLPFEAGLSLIDLLIDISPGADVHMKVRRDQFVSTSFGIAVRRLR